MSDFYGDEHRAFQDQFETRRMADLMEQAIFKTELDDMDRQFVQTRDMFFLSTLDHRGRPTVSYKGGDAGFIKIVDSRTIAFPSYDGNGMFRSLGNVIVNAAVGMLFIDFESPRRLRVNGLARLCEDDDLLAAFTGAQLIVRVRAERIFPNCPRYIHRTASADPSPYVPRPGYTPPQPKWKSMEMFSDVLPRDSARG